MSDNKYTRYVFAAALTLAGASAFQSQAQYDQDISVEGKYVPEVIILDRIGMFPRPVKFPLEKSSLQYSLNGVNADFTPQAVPIQVTGWQSDRENKYRRGYVELGLGSMLESTLSAGYRFISDTHSALGVRLQHNSTSLWKPELDKLPDTKMSRYDETIGVYGHHIFDGYGRLDAAVDYHIGNFNYYGFNPLLAPADNTLKAPTQTLNDVSFRATWHSPSGGDRISWNAGAGVRYFGYRSMYLPSAGGEAQRLAGGRETDVNISGGILFPTSGSSSLGIDLNADILAYGNPEDNSGAGLEQMPELDTYGLVSLTPFYRFVRSGVNIKVGAKIDLAANAGPEGDRYGVFHIAPVVSADYSAGPVTVFAHAAGGSELHTLAADYGLDYYQSPALDSTTPIYTPLDARIGVGFGPFAGFSAGIDVAYRISRGQYWGGMYSCWLNGGFPADGYNLPAQIDGRDVNYVCSPRGKSNLSGFSFGLRLGYDSGRYFSITAEGRYQPQKGKTGYFNGYDRPECTASVVMESNPWSTLKLRLGYNLRAQRKMPVEAHYADTTPLNSNLIEEYRLPNLSMLNFGVSYGITDNINVWVQGDNLLNRRNYLMPGLPEPGIMVTAGAGFYF